MLLLKFLRCGVTANEAVVSGLRKPLGYQQVTPTGAAAKLAPPTAIAGATIGYMVIQCDGVIGTDIARWRDDGVAPTAGAGMKLLAGQELDYTGDPYNIQFIIGAGAPVLNISYYA